MTSSSHSSHTSSGKLYALLAALLAGLSLPELSRSLSLSMVSPSSLRGLALQQLTDLHNKRGELFPELLSDSVPSELLDLGLKKRSNPPALPPEWLLLRSEPERLLL